ncbi:MAG: 2-keto-4-pentenoate hydratase [Pseudomonadota bacterium]
MGSSSVIDADRALEISSAIVRERRNAGSLARFPGALPAGLAEAYQVQALSRKAWPDRIIGWKVGGIPPAHREALGEDYLSGPIFARRFFQAVPDRAAAMPVFADGFAAIEPEFVLMMGATSAHDRVFIGAEIASSPIVDINGVGPIAVVCDFGNNNGLLRGPEIADWRDMEGVCVPVTTEIDGEIVGQKDVLDLPAAVMRARDFMVDLAEREGIDLPAGTYISTGAITGVHDSACGAKSTLRFGTWGDLDIELVAEQPFA